jgi:hypothetical protein
MLNRGELANIKVLQRKKEDENIINDEKRGAR